MVTDDALREAAGRLLGGTPLRSEGTLTIRGLALEAGVSRASIYRSSVLAEFREFDTLKWPHLGPFR